MSVSGRNRIGKNAQIGSFLSIGTRLRAENRGSMVDRGKDKERIQGERVS